MPVQTSFGQVVAAGPAGGVGLWGAVVKCKGAVHSICLDLLPDSWQRQADIKEVRLVSLLSLVYMA